MSLRVLLVGSGGREHALAWKLAESSKVEQIFVAPGNGGIRSVNKVNNVNLAQDDFPALVKFAKEQRVNLLVPGPEAPLVDGIVDYFKENAGGIRCFGPMMAAARMEGSKAFSKDFMKRHSIPTAAYASFSSHAEAKAYLDSNKDKKLVIKASGLAAGKGVIIPETYEEAVTALSSIMVDHEFGAAGETVVFEEFLEGDELSVLSFSDGYTVRSLPAAQDHKRINDGDEGPNTGGMGCYSPCQIATPEVMARIQVEVLQPTINGMRKEGFPFIGCLFTGYMLTKDGPKLLEYNVRFGDPETQTVLPLLETDLAEIMVRATEGWLDSIDIEIKPAFSTTVVVAAGGYPGKYDKGTKITLDQTPAGTHIFHAGTAYDESTQTLTSTGGRVIASTAIGSSITDAVSKAYAGVATIHMDRMHYRRDIAHRDLARVSAAASLPSTSATATEMKTSADQSALTYASAGVSIESGNSLVSMIKPLVRATARPGADALIGGFGGEIHLPSAGYGANSPTIVSAIDGIGTKLMIAQALNEYSTIGIDLVAMNVNDLIVQGAEPLAFLDYYACSTLDVPSAAAFVSGVADGCKQANCALVGGETAEMPGLYAKGDFDAAGCAIGALAAGKSLLPDKQGMKVGDVLLGIASSGPHSNGYSLIRKIVQRAGLKYTDPAPWTTGPDADAGVTVGKALLEPTKIYVKSLLAVLDGSAVPSPQEAQQQREPSATASIASALSSFLPSSVATSTSAPSSGVKGLAHITGGGLLENIPRILPAHLSAHVDIGSWTVPPVLAWLKREGRVESREFARAFNTGLGMVLVVEGAKVEGVVEGLRAGGERVWVVGEIKERGGGEDEGCVLQGLEKWNDL